ncbi:MAG: ABC transporter permease [Chloroflexota bacterium]
MRSFWGVVSYEYRMGVRRWGMWLAFLLAGAPYITNFAASFEVWQSGQAIDSWRMAGTTALMTNVLMPVVGGIVIADRLARDRRLGVWELFWSTPLSRTGYVLGKYVGAVLAVLTPVLAIWLAALAAYVATGAPLAFATPALAAFLTVIVPAYAFVGAFSIACPAVLPVRVYQVLFTGYWFWGNFLNPDFLPTLAGTLLTPSGEYAAAGFFATGFGPGQGHTAFEAVLSLLVLAACAGAALFVLERYLAWQAARA